MKKLLCIVSLMALSAVAQAERVTINLQDQLYTEGHTFKLKKLIRSQAQNFNLRSKRINKVTLIAKTENGQGSAYLTIGDSKTKAITIQGRAYNFDSNKAYSYDGVEFKNNQALQQGRWQLRTSGIMKVRKILIDLDHVEQWSWAEYDTFYTRKYGKSDDSLFINEYIKGVKIEGIQNSSHIKKAIVTLENGKTINLKSLLGKVGKEQTKKALFKHARDVKKLDIEYRPHKKAVSGGFELTFLTEERTVYDSEY